MVDAFNEKDSTIGVLEDSIQGELNVFAILDVAEVGCDQHVVVVDWLEHVVEPFDDLDVSFFKAFVKLD